MTLSDRWTDPATLRLHLPAPRLCHCGSVHRLRRGDAAFEAQLARRPYVATVTDAWTDPSEGGTLDRDTGQSIREVDWDNVLSNLKYLGGTAGGHCCKAFHASNQSIANNTLTALAFDSESFDTNTMHDLVTNNGRITIKSAGKYRLTAQVKWDANATGYRAAFIRDSGATAQGEDVRAAGPATVQTSQQVVAIVAAAVNDWFDVAVQQTSGGALNAVTGAGATWFAAEKIG